MKKNVTFKRLGIEIFVHSSAALRCDFMFFFSSFSASFPFLKNIELKIDSNFL